MRRLFFHEESIHEVSRRYHEHEYIHFFKVGGIKMVAEYTKLSDVTNETFFKKAYTQNMWAYANISFVFATSHVYYYMHVLLSLT